ncbi:uncharacterized protein PHACADRAFT_251867 [Phanerochaete carnosa HHB-10118-sp]|uniref:Kinetochore protein Sos7 coiled-coil domain-containing protein n=1 Tax=Phanerochaete carnosa (strain HHB-10118-sp) TaxID=650164 RepID=K5V5L0_PHACS|nr:uncharacterized protein PHACADRAFT_251867 [Phanerochaete carnosa HHB-10118-sp]EKM57946.1 hypothetical protein PHACADRAFT_251867 [Phanerochaete carnosa HHB-10118-sp]
MDPASISLDLTAQLAFFRKLKFQYLEQKAKDSYIKIIVNDDAPSIYAADNEAQRELNEHKKRELREKKLRLAEMQSNIRTLAPLIEQDCTKVRSLTEESVGLSRKILDARLKLTRLRQAYPQPRLTVPSAEAQLDAQVLEMQTLEDKLQNLNDAVDSMKDKVKSGAREVEWLSGERGEIEKLVKSSKSEDEDAQVVRSYKWYTAALKLHRKLHSLVSFVSPSENELHLEYAIRSSSASGTWFPVVIILLFVPNTRQLADVQVSDLPLGSDMSDIIGAHIQANDVVGVVAAVLGRARGEIADEQA